MLSPHQDTRRQTSRAATCAHVILQERLLLSATVSLGSRNEAGRVVGGRPQQTPPVSFCRAPPPAENSTRASVSTPQTCQLRGRSGVKGACATL